jgi:hypothetical protein
MQWHPDTWTHGTDITACWLEFGAEDMCVVEEKDKDSKEYVRFQLTINGTYLTNSGLF